MEINEDLPFALQELRSDEVVKENVVDTLAGLMVDAVEERVEEEVAIAFSGGIDSTLLAFICDKLGKKFSLYTVGFEDSKDVVSARETAKQMGWKVKEKIITIENVEDVIKKVISITGKRDPVTVGVGAVTYLALSMVEEDFVMTGLGSEEIFAGYERHKVKDVNAACWEGLLDIWNRDIVRDLAIANYFEKKVCLPFLDKELIEYGMKIDASLKIGEYKKQVLREAAVSLGLPEEFAFRKKCAAQYGSKFDNAIEKLAKKKNMKKKEYLNSL